MTDEKVNANPEEKRASEVPAPAGLGDAPAPEHTEGAAVPWWVAEGSRPCWACRVLCGKGQLLPWYGGERNRLAKGYREYPGSYAQDRVIPIPGRKRERLSACLKRAHG